MTYFPDFEELRVLWQTDIRTIYFFGDINNEEAANFINDINGEYGESEPEMAFEVINLKV
jgi:hypothetical protein